MMNHDEPCIIEAPTTAGTKDTLLAKSAKAANKAKARKEDRPQSMKF